MCRQKQQTMCATSNFRQNRQPLLFLSLRAHSACSLCVLTLRAHSACSASNSAHSVLESRFRQKRQCLSLAATPPYPSVFFVSSVLNLVLPYPIAACYRAKTTRVFAPGFSPSASCAGSSEPRPRSSTEGEPRDDATPYATDATDTTYAPQHYQRP